MPALPLQPGDPRAVGRYRLTGRLGEGGQGVVYLGQGPAGERVAVKVLKTTDAGARARFAREMRAARQVAPFCTAAVLDSSAEGELPYVVSEYVDGPSLQQRVDERGPLRGGELERLAVNTASALAAIHGAGIVHRDLKPANVLLGPDGPRVVDFGIARAIDAETHTQLVGTPSYFAPEWLDGHPPTDRSDVFAWAGTIVYAATGRPPFGRAAGLPAILHRIAGGEPDLGGVPPSLLPLLTECLSKDPARRPAARDLMVRLVDPSATSPSSGPAHAGPPAPPPATQPPTTQPPAPPSRTAPPPAAAPHAVVPPAAVPSAETTHPGAGGVLTRGRLVGGAVALALLACVGGAVLLLKDDDARHDAGSEHTGAPSATPSASAPGSPSGSASDAGTRTGGSTGSSVPAAFAGVWKGRIVQTGGLAEGNPASAVVISLRAGATEGTSDYDDWGCHDTLRVTGVSSSAVSFQETAKNSNGLTGFCIGGPVTLKRAGDALEYTSSSDFGSTTGRLLRAG